MEGLAAQLQSKVKAAAGSRLGVRRPAPVAGQGRTQTRREGQAGVRRRLDRGRRGDQSFADGFAAGLPADPHHAAHAGAVHDGIRPNGSTASARCGSVRPRTTSGSNPAMSISRPVHTTSKSPSTARTWCADCPMVRRSAGIGLRSTFCSARPRAFCRLQRSASFSRA